MNHKVGTDPLDRPRVHVGHLKQRRLLWVSSPTVNVDHVSHPPLVLFRMLHDPVRSGHDSSSDCSKWLKRQGYEDREAARTSAFCLRRFRIAPLLDRPDWNKAGEGELRKTLSLLAAATPGPTPRASDSSSGQAEPTKTRLRSAIIVST